MATTAAGVVRKVGIATWTVLDDHTDRVRAIVSAETRGFAVRNDEGRVLGRFATVREALEALPTICD
ncbi:MAG TPA: hypothetical protein VGO65_01850 [Pseudolysinimonas sp.]|nr:hypothetical protein [Pseudolysinimonas sp.]